MPRPDVSEETEMALRDATEGDFNVPDERVSFEDRVRVLIQKYEALESNTRNANFR